MLFSPKFGYLLGCVPSPPPDSSRILVGESGECSGARGANSDVRGDNSKMRNIFTARKRGGPWVVYYTSPQCFIISFSYPFNQ